MGWIASPATEKDCTEDPECKWMPSQCDADLARDASGYPLVPLRCSEHESHSHEDWVIDHERYAYVRPRSESQSMNKPDLPEESRSPRSSTSKYWFWIAAGLPIGSVVILLAVFLVYYMMNRSAQTTY